tara:strand:- start:758 stop:988 length:231 start_codon:yes stop_codon:yes gene_type:complete
MKRQTLKEELEQICGKLPNHLDPDEAARLIIQAFNKILPKKKTLASDTSYSDKGMHILHEGNGFNQCVDQIKEKMK